MPVDHNSTGYLYRSSRGVSFTWTTGLRVCSLFIIGWWGWFFDTRSFAEELKE
jgi:hypothetical protein